MQNEPTRSYSGISHGSTSSLCLIPRSQRRRFFVGFVLMTVVGWVVGGIAARVFLETTNQIVLSANPQIQWLWYHSWFYVVTAVFALIFAIDQALVMRKYISGWWWFVATFLGWLFSESISRGWETYIRGMAASLGRDLMAIEQIFFATLLVMASCIAWTWLGFSQWVVLRKYVQGSWWWIFLHTFSRFVISFLVWLLSLGHDFIPEAYRLQALFLGEQGVSAAVLAIIPAIAACRLKRNSTSHVVAN